MRPIEPDAQPKTVKAKLTINDPDRADSIGKIQVIGEGAKVLKEIAVSGNSYKGEIELENNSGFYYIKVIQGDGDIAVTAPVWTSETVPVAVDVYIQRPLPMSRPKRCDGEDDTYKPDADNVAKLVLDALSGVAYEDDAQVVRVCVTKARRRRGVDEHMTVTIRRPDWGDR